jgi:hypothetical protein
LAAAAGFAAGAAGFLVCADKKPDDTSSPAQTATPIHVRDAAFEIQNELMGFSL